MHRRAGREGGLCDPEGPVSVCHRLCHRAAAVALAGRLVRAGVATRRNIRPVDQLRTRGEGMQVSNCENEFVGRLAGADAPLGIFR
jgi:hypothetical protein